MSYNFIDYLENMSSASRSGSSSPDSASDQRLSALYSGNSRPTSANSSTSSVNLPSNNTQRQVTSMYPNLPAKDNNKLAAPMDCKCLTITASNYYTSICLVTRPPPCLNSQLIQQLSAHSVT